MKNSRSAGDFCSGRRRLFSEVPAETADCWMIKQSGRFDLSTHALAN